MLSALVINKYDPDTRQNASGFASILNVSAGAKSIHVMRHGAYPRLKSDTSEAFKKSAVEH
jgi:hypothetical protein